MTQNTDQDFHFYAANAGRWAVTTKDRDLRDLIKLMEQDDMPFTLFYLPVPQTAVYQIRFYQPEVEGAIYMGTFEPKTKAKRRK